MNSFWSNDSLAYPAEMCETHKVCPWPNPLYTSAIAFSGCATAGILVHPHILLLEGLRLLLQLLLLLQGLLIVLISRTLATADTPLLFFYGRHLGRTISVILPVISPLVLVIGVIELPRSTGVVVVPLSLPLSL
jgi:hypothetical protein